MQSKIEEVAALDGSVDEMAYYCDVARQTIYNWLEENPDLMDKVERLRARPVLKARRTILDKMDDSYSNAMDYVKRKRKLEFGDNIDVTTDGEKIEVVTGMKIISEANDGEDE